MKKKSILFTIIMFFEVQKRTLDDKNAEGIAQYAEALVKNGASRGEFQDAISHAVEADGAKHASSISKYFDKITLSVGAVDSMPLKDVSVPQTEATDNVPSKADERPAPQADQKPQASSERRS